MSFKGAVKKYREMIADLKKEADFRPGRVEVVLPVVNTGLADALLAQIAANSLHPQKIIIINNSGDPDWPRDSGPLNLAVYTPTPPLGCNASWMGVMDAIGDCEAVAFLNDDIFINPQFFDRLGAAFMARPEAGVVCPLTVGMIEAVHRPTPSEPDLVLMKRREGWAFTIRKKLLKDIPPIPRDLKNWFGDDWFWHFSHKLGRPWFRDHHNLIFHYVGVAVKKMGVRFDLNRERAIFRSKISCGK